MTTPRCMSLLDKSTLVRVSSTLDKTTGKRNLIDNSPETCWTSQQGLPQFIQFIFPERRVVPARVSITFQGGFVGTSCAIYLLSSLVQKDWKLLAHVYPEDVNRQQLFDLPQVDDTLLRDGAVGVKFVFEESSDFFGRVTVYDLKLEGSLN